MVRKSPRTETAAELLQKLARLYPEARCALVFATPFQLLVATILSAQCTDARVNLVTPGLFRRYPDAAWLAAARLEELEEEIRSTGFFHNKAKALIGCATRLIEHYGGTVPQTLEELVTLPGVGRKTANVLLGTAFHLPAMVVDTHIGRLARRFGWSRSHDPGRIEQDLCTLLPEAEWISAGHRLIAHGRALCRARRPACNRCPLLPDCPRIGVD